VRIKGENGRRGENNSEDVGGEIEILKTTRKEIMTKGKKRRKLYGDEIRKGGKERTYRTAKLHLGSREGGFHLREKGKG